MEKKVLQPSVPEHHQLLELLMEHLLFCLRMCKSTVVLTQCLRLIDTLLLWKLDSLKSNVDALRSECSPCG